MSTRPPTRVSLVAIPKAMPSILVGLHDVLSSVGALPTLETPIEPAPFEAEIVGGVPGRCACHGGACHACAHPPGADETDIVLVPSLLADSGRWATGRHPELIDWIARMNAGGAILASACSGLFPLADRTFARRFTTTAGLSPIADVQRLRVEDARRRLERTDAPVERIAWEVGSEDPAAFRRLFRRGTGLAPGAARRRFQVPASAQPAR